MENINLVFKWDKKLNSIDATQIVEIYDKPTLIHLNKGAGNPIVLATLLHGNEHSGFEALKQFLQKHESIENELLIFIGNPIAASSSKRQLDDGNDYNRLWSDDIVEKPPFVNEVKSYIDKISPSLVIDMHNNTGKNPLYSCISFLDKSHLALASYFGEATIYFKEPHSAFSVYYSNYYTSMTVEAGKSMMPKGITKLMEMLELLIIEQGGKIKHINNNKRTYRTIGKVKIPNNATVSFTSENKDTDFIFEDDFDELNFTHLLPGLILAKSKKLPIVLDDDNNDIAGQFLKIEGENLVITKEIVPAMLTKEISIIYSDGLCYFMIEVFEGKEILKG